tara:strand:+ start:1058 stop:1705 length:648 start_codon:yes stop_codon:yes gene_type:complete
MEEQVKTSYGFKVLDERKNTTGNILQAIVEDVFETNIMDPKRLRQNVDARRMFGMVLRSMEKPYTFARIGRYLKKDHATILHYMKTSEDILQTDVDFKNKYQEVKERFTVDLKKLDLIKGGIEEQSHRGDVLRLKEYIKNLKEEITSLKDNANTDVAILQGKINRRNTELKKYNVRYSGLYKTINDRTKAGTEDLIQRKLNTLFNGVYSEVIDCY